MAMGTFRPPPICFSLLLPFLFHLSFAAYTLPEQHFINCGSASAVKLYGRTFTGDASFSDNGNPVEDPSSSASQLYQTARIFRKPGTGTYELDIAENGTHVVRFHFFPFSSLGNVSDARFSVEASRFRVLSNFSIQNATSVSNFPRIEEFLLTIPMGKFKIKFVPDGENYFAFVNAMEVFLAPPDFIPDSATAVTSEGRKAKFNDLLFSPLKVIHRINVGGLNIMPNNDTLLRSWIPDDSYLINKDTAKNSDPYNGNLYYQTITDFVAPYSVYNTAKELKIDNSTQLNRSDILWRFDVKKGAEYLVRLHFCDIVSATPNENLTFNLFIYSKFEQMMRPYDYGDKAAPFYNDFVVDSDHSGFLNISVGPRSESRNPTAFLNGLEIFELITELGSSQEGGGSTRRRLLIIVGSVVGGLILVLIFVVVLYLGLRERQLKRGESFNYPVVPTYGGSSHTKSTDKTVSGSSHGLSIGLKLSIPEILYATNNFDNKLIIGKGGFGKVYSGTLRNGTKVAVKRSEEGHGQGFSEFQTEIILLSKIHHHHLVSLVGYCDEMNEMILVYEFMEKGTLMDHLYIWKGESCESRCELSWDQRLGMCIGAAKGIHYLHTGSNGAIIHRDIKSTNILLDDHFVAKVADFGLSRLGPPDQTHVSTAVKGSFGYLDPDYFICSQLTLKSDVYSFGVVLLEVLCARPAINQTLPREQVNLAEWGLTWQRKGQLEKIVDPFLEGKINPNSLRKFGEIVEKCLQEYGGDRPDMVDVLWDLEYCLKLQHTAVSNAPYGDTTTDDVSLGFQMDTLQRLPSHSIPIDEDELDNESYSFSDVSQVNASDAFSQLKIDEAR